MVDSPSGTTDEQLLRQYLQGDCAALVDLYKRYHVGLRQTLNLSLSRRPIPGLDGEDVAAEVWLRLLRDPGRLLTFDATRGSFFGFLLLLAWDRIRALRRHGGRRNAREVALGDHESVDNGAELDQLAADLEEFLAGLSPAHREWLEAEEARLAAKRPRTAAEQKRVERLRQEWLRYQRGERRGGAAPPEMGR